MYIDDSFEIVKEYPVAPDEDPEACHFGKLSASSERSRRDAIDRIEIEFYRDNPLAPSEFTGKTQWNPVEGRDTVALEGWLSPGGDYYPHEYGRHNQVAEHLAAQLYGDPSASQGRLCAGRYVCANAAGRPFTTTESWIGRMNWEGPF